MSVTCVAWTYVNTDLLQLTCTGGVVAFLYVSFASQKNSSPLPVDSTRCWTHNNDRQKSGDSVAEHLCPSIVVYPAPSAVNWQMVLFSAGMVLT